MDEKTVEKFELTMRNLAPTLPGRKIVILVTQVDPDAIGAAIGLRALLRDGYDMTATIYYCGGFGHPQNRCVANLFGLADLMKPIGDFPEEEIDKTVFMLVDSSSVTDARLGSLKGRIKPVVVIDHHEGGLVEQEGSFVWIEPVGAASSMVASLCASLEYDLDRESDRRVAKLLALGIYSDTKALVGAREFDRKAYAFVTGFFPAEEMADLIDYPLPESHYDNLRRALSDLERVNNVIVAGCGQIPPDQGDDLSTIADYLIRMIGVTQVFVWAVIGNAVRISARNTDLSIAFHEYLQSSFGKRSGSKLGVAGRSEGGALITLNLDFWSAPGTEVEVSALVRRRLNLLLLKGSKQ